MRGQIFACGFAVVDAYRFHREQIAVILIHHPWKMCIRDRLWISSMEDVAIKEGFENLRSGTEYDALYEAALDRKSVV